MTFAIGDSDAEGTAFRKKSEFVFERPLSAQSIRNTLKPAYGLILRERRRYFRCPISIPVIILRRKHAGSSLQQRKYQRRGYGSEHARSAHSRRKASGFSSRCRITKYHSWQNRRSAGRKRAISEFASCLFRTSTNPNYRSGYHESWKRHFRNSLPDKFQRAESCSVPIRGIESTIRICEAPGLGKCLTSRAPQVRFN